jgi:sterol desaturase/sphingolipid hydroxylase (fatty acid hydroxylase superfamily)
MVYLLVFVIGLLALTFLGYITHYAFHQPWSGRLFQAHMVHHQKLYPVDNFLSDVYRDAGSDNTTYLFALVFAPIVLAALLLTVFNIIPIAIGLEVLGLMAVIGWANNSIHDSMHLTNSIWHNFWFFNRLQKLHLNHHAKMDTNFGIFSFWWDRVFRTFAE